MMTLSISASTLSTLSLVAFIIAGVSFVTAIFLWIYFKIPGVIGDLSGKNAKKSIERMRASNENSGNKSYRSSKTNAERGKLTSTIPGVDQNKAPVPNAPAARAPMAQPVAPAQPARPAGPGYVPITGNDSPETGLLAENRSTDVGDATDLLYDPNATVLLDETPKQPPKRVGGIPITLTERVIFIHTQEVIG